MRPVRTTVRASARIALVLSVLISVSGCATMGRRHVDPSSDPIQKAAGEISEEELLDVWIEIFDPGELPTNDDDAMGLSMDIREAEARFMPVHLRRTMEKTGYWGAVRVVPRDARDTEGAELLVRGTIVQSDGERTVLEIVASDATGRRWLREKYDYKVPLQDYLINEPATGQGDASNKAEIFQPLYDAIANDLARSRERLSARELAEVRRMAELRFAADLAPDAFAAHIHRDDKGRYEIVRLPAHDDPMYRRIQAIRTRDFLLIDVLSDHVDNFYREMEVPYEQWREARAEEAIAMRAVEREANSRKLLGVAAIAGAIGLEILGVKNTGTLETVMVVGGAYALKSGIDMAAQTKIHSDAIEELGDSFASETKPLVVEVEGETHELTGSAETQYTKWRELLRQIYASETGAISSAN